MIGWFVSSITIGMKMKDSLWSNRNRFIIPNVNKQTVILHHKLEVPRAFRSHSAAGVLPTRALIKSVQVSTIIRW